MELPTRLHHTRHKHGGKITRVHSIKHSTEEPVDGYSRDTWFFVANVEWDDGGTSEGLGIHPALLCYADDDRSEIDDLTVLMTEYLTQNGTWDHEHVVRSGWSANR
jgi:hypothetical protein